MTDKLISVIIPCYNVERYAVKCLESVLAQTYENLEVIVIDDGSADGTAEILRHFANRDNRVKLIAQANAGVSAARNRGINAAGGEMIAFADSDDWLELEMYARLYDAMTANGADMAVCDYNVVYGDGHADGCYSSAREATVEVYDDVYGYFAKYCACPKPNNYIWTRLYGADLVKKSGVRFERYGLGDDTLFSFKLLPFARRVSFIAGGMYNYYQRPDSNVYTIANKSNLAAVYADTFDALADYYRDNDFKEFLSVLPLHAFTRLRSVFFYSRLAGMDERAIVESVMEGFKGRNISDYITGRSM